MVYNRGAGRSCGLARNIRFLFIIQYPEANYNSLSQFFCRFLIFVCHFSIRCGCPIPDRLLPVPPEIFTERKPRFMETAYQNIAGKSAGEVARDIADFLSLSCPVQARQEMDLANLRDQDWEVLESYEEEHFSFIISDDQFEPVYTTVSRDQEGTVRRNIEIQKDLYTREPRAVLRNTRSYGGVQLRGIVDQDGRFYYVCIRETSGSSYSAFFYTEQFLAAVVIVAIVLGSVVMFVLGRRITKPIEVGS